MLLFQPFYPEPADVPEDWCYKFGKHSGKAARRGAAIVLGDTAAVYAERDLARTRSVLEKLREDSAIKVVDAEDGLATVLHRGGK